jgi:hypothetical protein
MNGEKRFWLRVTYIFLALPAMGLLGWGILVGELPPGTPFSVARRDPAGSALAMGSTREIRLADSGRWCDEGLGCNDAS